MSTRPNYSKYDIDRWLNRIIPANRLYLLPRWINHFLGYRSKDKPQKPIIEPLIWFWSFVGAFAGVGVLEGVYSTDHLFEEKHVPIIVGSFGASAILLYNAIESPLAQPRNVFFGNLIAAVVGCGITKLFLLRGADRYDDLRWLAGALSVATCSSLMGITKTIHPPAGATALLAAVDSNIRHLGWYYVAVIALSNVLVLGVAIVVNNIQRRYPVYWWTPVTITKPKPGEDLEKHSKESTSIPLKKAEPEEKHGIHESMLKKEIIMITEEGITVPEGFRLAAEERGVLEILSGRLRPSAENKGTDASDRGSGTSTADSVGTLTGHHP